MTARIDCSIVLNVLVVILCLTKHCKLGGMIWVWCLLIVLLYRYTFEIQSFLMYLIYCTWINLEALMHKRSLLLNLAGAWAHKLGILQERNWFSLGRHVQREAYDSMCSFRFSFLCLEYLFITLWACSRGTFNVISFVVPWLLHLLVLRTWLQTLGHKTKKLLSRVVVLDCMISQV